MLFAKAELRTLAKGVNLYPLDGCRWTDWVPAKPAGKTSLCEGKRALCCLEVSSQLSSGPTYELNEHFEVVKLVYVGLSFFSL